MQGRTTCNNCKVEAMFNLIKAWQKGKHFFASVMCDSCKFVFVQDIDEETYEYIGYILQMEYGSIN